MEAEVIAKDRGWVTLRLWTGEVLRQWWEHIPIAQRLNVGDRLEVNVKEVKWITAARLLRLEDRPWHGTEPAG